MRSTVTHSHSGRRPSCTRISRIARPVCSVSSSAIAGTRSSNARARRARTFERWMAGARDHTPDSKAAWASTTARSTSSELAASTLHGSQQKICTPETSLASLPIGEAPRHSTYVQMCRPVAGFVTGNLMKNMRSRKFQWESCLTLREIPSVAC